MEFGSHCFFPDCNRLDFLPVSCFHCKKNFCFEHKDTNSHDCCSAENLSLQKTVRDNNTLENSEKSSLIQCFFKNCPSLKKLNQATQKSSHFQQLVECKSCKRHFCISHRSEISHECDAPEKKKNLSKISHQSQAVPLRKSD
eukprot:Sdes_comp15889_c0_seq1m5004